MFPRPGKYRKYLIALSLLVLGIGVIANSVSAQVVPPDSPFVVTKEATDSAEATAAAEVEVEPSPTPRPDFTQSTEENIGPLEQILREQELGSPYIHPVRYAIREAVDFGIPPNTIVLLLLLPVIAAVIAAARNVIGVRGFGIFFPASLSIVFLAIGPVIGVLIFLLIVFTSTWVRLMMRKAHYKLQYLPRMALIVWFVVLSVLGLLFLAPIIPIPDITNVSIFPVLILVLLAEDFSKVQRGKSARTAIEQATETILLALFCYVLLVSEIVREYVLLNPELVLISVGIFDIILGKYVGLRFIEYWRFRKLIRQ